MKRTILNAGRVERAAIAASGRRHMKPAVSDSEYERNSKMMIATSNV
jgi:hypothetical protein